METISGKADTIGPTTLNDKWAEINAATRRVASLEKRMEQRAESLAKHVHRMKVRDHDDRAEIIKIKSALGVS